MEALQKCSSRRGCRQFTKPQIWNTYRNNWQDLEQHELDPEAKQFKHYHNKDVQFVLSRYQHHWHAWDDSTKTRKPMKYRIPRSKEVRKKGKLECKGRFPRTVRREKNGKIIKALCRPQIVCLGVAEELDLKDSGRKNMLEARAGTRRNSWSSATSAMLVKVIRSNTNTQTDYRIPISTRTHDPHCTKKRYIRALSSWKQTRKSLRIAQRTRHQMVDYFSGYISIRQKVGQYELKKVSGVCHY